MKIKSGKKDKPKSFKPRKQIDDDLEEDYPVPAKWYESIVEDPKKIGNVTEQVLIELKEEAKKCHDAEVANYNIKNNKTNSNFQWMKTVMSKGTVSDKIAAHTVSIQDNPVCNLETLQNLINMVKVGKKRECIVVIETLTDLFLNDLLRPDRKLKTFDKRPLTLLNELSSGNAITRRKLLSVWYFEDQLKESYTAFVRALNTAAHDSVDSNKEKAIGAMYKLLAGNPEQEKNLLSYLINKLGDPSQKVASKSIYCLTQLLFKHPNMQAVVLNEVEKLLFRPNISTRAQYYSLCFLSQFYLDHESNEIARKLIEVYFAFFKGCVKTGDVDSRMMSALLMGINRAYPYAKLEFEKMAEHIDTMYRLVHLGSFNICIQALTLLYQVSQDNLADRFFSALYKKLLDPQLLVTTHQAMLLSLIYKALLKDSEVNRIKMFVKRLLQISTFAQQSFACGILYLVSQLLRKKSDVQATFLKQTNIEGDDDNDDEEKYKDVELKDEIKIKEEPLDEIEHNEIKIDPNTIEIKEEDDEEVKPDIKPLNASWCHRKLSKEQKPLKYNPLVRNPLYGGGEYAAYTELSQLTNHFHPTVALYSKNILDGVPITYSGDPLKDFTLIRFLDRFVFKNPKRVEGRGAHPTFGKRKFYRPKGVKTMPVISSGYIKEDRKNIPVDELFVYSYLQQKYQEKQINEEEDSDLESVQSEEFEEMLEKMAGVKNAEEDIDFMDDIGDNLKNKSKQKKKKGEEESDEELEASDEEDEEDIDGIDEEEEDVFGDMDDEDKDLIGDIDEDEDEDIEFGDSEEEEPPKKSKKKSKAKGDTTSIFASAEEFAALLEEEGGSEVKPGGSNALSNKDNAHQKQLAWEGKRNRWLKGFDKAVGGKGGRFSKGKKRKGGGFEKKGKKIKQ